MYMVAFMYPNTENGSFNFDHFVNVHLPMGLSLTQKHLSIKPKKIVVYSPTRGADGTPASAAYITISSVFFDSREEADIFAGLFEVEEAARRLSADFANYTPAAPDVLIAKVTELTDMDGMIDAFEQSGTPTAS